MATFINKRTQGEYFEKLALNFLISHGFTLLKKNYYSKFGEIDLILQKDDLIVFVEVRQKSTCFYGSPFESITTGKQRKIYLTSLDYIRRNNLTNFNFRFDAVIFNSYNKLEWEKSIMWGDEFGF